MLAKYTLELWSSSSVQPHLYECGAYQVEEINRQNVCCSSDGSWAERELVESFLQLWMGVTSLIASVDFAAMCWRCWTSSAWIRYMWSIYWKGGPKMPGMYWLTICVTIRKICIIILSHTDTSTCTCKPWSSFGLETQAWMHTKGWWYGSGRHDGQ